ncbi:DNA-directed RNA polymerase subunit omega [Candidatus Pelagibacter sp.]|nr:DNA-directed RNA polymerase subunit omega [Candidatus Pelagibacter sp.]
MARVTVEDCIDKVESPYELVLVAKERATQLNSGIEPTIERDNDKNTVISLREIAEDKIKVSDLLESAVYKLRKHVEQVDDGSDDDEEVGDDFESMYKGEISKSGTPILPSKRARKTPERIQVAQEDLAELSETAKPDVDIVENVETTNDQGEVSLDEVSEAENQEVTLDEVPEAENQEVTSEDSNS